MEGRRQEARAIAPGFFDGRGHAWQVTLCSAVNAGLDRDLYGLNEGENYWPEHRPWPDPASRCHVYWPPFPTLDGESFGSISHCGLPPRRPVLSGVRERRRIAFGLTGREMCKLIMLGAATCYPGVIPIPFFGSR